MRKLVLIAAAVIFSASAQSPWLHIFSGINNYSRFSNVKVESIVFEPVTQNVIIKLIDGEEVSIRMTDIDHMRYCSDVPLLSITTDEFVEEIPSKETYSPGSIHVHGYGHYDDENISVNIKGRGNTTWKYPKKPYRIKFDKKISLCGMKKAKNYVLLANYIDPSLMRNVMALKAAQLMGLPYANHMVPVDVVFNGIDRGSYLLTEKVGLNAASVDIDECRSILLELDVNYDVEWKFISNGYSVSFNGGDKLTCSLPVMVKDPDFSDPEILPSLAFTFDDWKDDFNAFEKAVYDDHPGDVLDLQSAAKTFVVFNITGNQEFNHPSSFYMFKEVPEGMLPGDVKYTFGPVWDFDWAYGYLGSHNHSSLLPYDIILNDYTGTTYPSSRGEYFFRKLLMNEDFMAAYEVEWENFYNNIYPQWMEYFDEYAFEQEPTRSRNGNIFTFAINHNEHVRRLREWITARVETINKDPYYLLYTK